MFSNHSIAQVRNVFFHAGCPDGISAREIHKACFPEFTGSYQPYGFGGKLLGTEREALLQNALFLDCHPNLDEVERAMAVYSVLVADHHQTFRDFLESHPGVAGQTLFLEEEETSEGATWGYSGARLSYLIGHQVNGHLPLDWNLLDAFSKLVSIGDTWKTAHPEFQNARRLANFITFFGNAYTGFHLPTDPIVQAFGKAMEARSRSVAARAIWREHANLRIAFIPTRDTSDVAEILCGESAADLVVGYGVFHAQAEGEWIQYSLRSRAGFSARSLAEFIGGGGHESAAGCSAEYLTGRDPIEYLLDCITRMKALGSSL